MDNQKFIKGGINTVMGVKEVTEDRTVQTNLENPQWDKAVTLKYIGATLVQIAVLVGLLWSADFAFARFDIKALPDWMPIAIACGFFAFVTLRSRFFSLLDNTRNSGRYTSLRRPSWAPPPLAFPIVWMSIAVLRVVSAYLVWSAMEQTFLCLPLVLFVVHLSLGDTWNTIFTVEGRLGLAVPAVILGPFLSVAILTISYYQTAPLAGWIIFPSWVWLTVATALCISLWQLNGKEPLYPLISQYMGDRKQTG
ncbi:tryptophan-rich sensory protein [Oscillatoria sp. CS-180]|uniref:TspO/MBR family protein n=1 Tax=Oscillatoria sp. CS-180 TaxID=3021720 RepID=UPI00232D57DF|nr:tryptophan-rich sensory protein [Oscillatoria sp. CS-180]MDB9525691.1 tryptophan-rich sensory protein [Oscillatoria sp. CS-180]